LLRDIMSRGESVAPVRSQRNIVVLVVVLAMVMIVAAAGLVVTYVAYPARGRQVPRAPWLGDALARGADRLGLAEDDHESRHQERQRAESSGR
jgi:uncharacterized membrane protein